MVEVEPHSSVFPATQHDNWFRKRSPVDVKTTEEGKMQQLLNLGASYLAVCCILSTLCTFEVCYTLERNNTSLWVPVN